MEKVTIIALAVFSQVAICEGITPNYPDLKAAWQANKGKCGELRPVGSVFELTLSADGKGGECISSVGSDLVIIKVGEGDKLQYMILPMVQLALRVPGGAPPN
jgi:hypothetical protein